MEAKEQLKDSTSLSSNASPLAATPTLNAFSDEALHPSSEEKESLVKTLSPSGGLSGQQQTSIHEKDVKYENLRIIPLSSENPLEKILDLKQMNLDEVTSTGKIFQPFELQEFTFLIEQSENKIKNSVAKEFFLVIGNTGSGKSTTICYLLGAIMEEIYDKSKGAHIFEVKKEEVKKEEVKKEEVKEEEEEEEEKSKDKEKEKKEDILPAELPKIGHLLTSETIIPSLYSSQLNDHTIHLCDCPGFIDNRGPAYKIVTRLNTRATIQGARDIKGIIVVIEESSLHIERSAGFRKLGVTFQQILRTPLKFPNSILFIFTKTSSRSTKEMILDRTQALIEEFHKNTAETTTTTTTSSSSYHSSDDREALKGALAMFYLIVKNPQNVFLIDLKDNKSREEIHTRLIECKSIPKFEFTFSAYEASQAQFEKVLFDVVSLGNIQLQTKYDLPIRIKQCKENIANFKESIHFYEERIQLLLSGEKIELQEEDRAVFTKRIDTIQKKLELNQAMMETLIQDTLLLEKERQELDTEEEVLLYESEIWQEERSFFGRLFWSTSLKIFTYNSHVRYTRVEKECKDGTWSSEIDSEEDKKNGIYSVTYTSNKGKDGYAWIKLFTEKKFKPENKARLATILHRLADNSSKINELKKIINIFEREINVFRTTLKTQAATLEEKEIQRQEQLKHFQAAKLEQENRIPILENDLKDLKERLEAIKQVVAKNEPLFQVFTKILTVLTDAPMGYHLSSIHSFLALSRGNLPLPQIDGFPQEFYCPITHTIMNDPVTAQCGHSFELSAITKYSDSCRSEKRVTSCHYCHQIVRIEKLRPNRTLQSAIQTMLERKKQMTTVPTEILAPNNPFYSPEDREKEKAQLEIKIANMENRLQKWRKRYEELCASEKVNSSVQTLPGSPTPIIKPAPPEGARPQPVVDQLSSKKNLGQK